jgi:hypothetical protein
MWLVMTSLRNVLHCCASVLPLGFATPIRSNLCCYCCSTCPRFDWHCLHRFCRQTAAEGFFFLRQDCRARENKKKQHTQTRTATNDFPLPMPRPRPLGLPRQSFLCLQSSIPRVPVASAVPSCCCACSMAQGLDSFSTPRTRPNDACQRAPDIADTKDTAGAAISMVLLLLLSTGPRFLVLCVSTSSATQAHHRRLNDHWQSVQNDDRSAGIDTKGSYRPL